MSEQEGFLGRWSRRKRAAAATTPPAPTPAPAEPVAEFDPASLPPVESLTAGSDITAFLRPQVPAALRTAALRRVWTLDPAIRDYVGPADYAWDFNAPDGMAGFSLELGGDVKRLLAQAIGLMEEAEEQPPQAATAELALAEPPPAPILPPPPEALPEPAPEAASEPAAPAPPPRRHGGARPV